MKSLQVCAGHEAGCESFIHAMCTVYENQSAEAVLLVDASNAFNSINRNTFLDNVEIIRPSITRYVKNCYSLSIRLSSLVVMGIYAIAIVPMILMLVEISLQRNCNTFTTAYANDLTAAGPIDKLKKWWDELCRLGPKLDYYP